MKVVVFSDLHLLYTVQNPHKQKDNILQKFHEVTSRINPDLFLFAGDILDKGTGNYTDSLNHFLDAVCIDRKKFHITCGNHDVKEDEISSMFIDHVNGFISNDEIEEFIRKNKGNDYKNSLNHLSHYNNYINENIPESNKVHDLYYISKFQSEGKTVSITSINTTWFYKYLDKKHIDVLYPLHVIKEIIDDISESDINILISHFPIDSLKEFNKIEIEKLIAKNFDILVSGHIHRITKGCVYSLGDGFFKCSTPSMIEQDDPNYSGFVFLDLNMDNLQVKIDEYNYFNYSFMNTSTFTENIPVDEQKKKIIQISQSIRNLYKNEIDKANEKFVLYNEDKYSFDEIFNEPIICDKREVDSLKNNKSTVDVNSKRVLCDDILNNKNYLIYGSDKSGKTMLLTYLQLSFFSESSNLKIIPIFIDFNNYYKQQKFKLSNEIKSQLNISGKLYEFLIENYHIKILIDNYKPSNTERNERFFHDCLEVENISFIFVVQNPYNYVPKVKIDHIEYEELFIHNIKRKQVRELTNKWPLIEKNKKEDVFNKIIALFSQLNIHFNYWTVSMFLWIFEKTSDINVHNDIELLDIYIENLLERSSLALNTYSFSYDNLKDFLGRLSYYIYSECETNNYCLSYSELIHVYENYRKSNIRVLADPREIVDYLLSKGIIISKSSDQYTFRLNGVFEYFLAHYMSIEESFFQEIISDSEKFLSFENELQIYAGLHRDKSILLQNIYIITLYAHDRLIELNPKFKEVIEDCQYSHSLSDSISTLVEKKEDLLIPLDESQKDELSEMINPIGTIDSAVKVKQKYKIENIDVELFNRHLFILSRILRNSDSISDEKLVKEIFSSIVELSCLSPRYLIREMTDKSDLFSDDDNEDFLEFLESYTPIIVHTFLYDALSHKNMRYLIKEKIDSELQQNNINSTKLFALYFLIIEVDLSNEMELIDEMIEELQDSYIQHSILLKLLMILYFKVNKGDPKEKKLRQQIIKVNSKVNPRDKSSLILQNVDNMKIKRQHIEGNE